MTVVHLTLVPANDNAKDPVSPEDACEACGIRERIQYGYCDVCIAEMNAVIDDRRGGDEWMPGPEDIG